MDIHMIPIMNVGLQELITKMPVLKSEYVLPDGWYIPVLANKHDANWIWINQDYESSLLTLAQIVNPDKSKPNLDDLGLITHLSDKSFFTKEDLDNYKSRALVLKTERFFSPYNQNIGAGRSAVISNYQYKGIGRNHAATRLDWKHTWGGLSLNEGISELLLERMLHKSFPDASVEILGLFKYKNLDQLFLIRDARFIRCAQCPENLLAEDIKNIRNYMAVNLNSSQSDDWHEIIVNRFIDMMKSGFVHLTPNIENITVDGRFLDHHSVECIDSNDDPFFIKIEKNSLEQFNGDLRQSLFGSNHLNVQTSLVALLMQIKAVEYAFKNLNIKTLSLEEVKEKIKFSFPNYACFLDEPNTLNRNVSELIIEKMDSNELTIVPNIDDETTINLSTGKSYNQHIRNTVTKSLVLEKMSSTGEVSIEDYRHLVQGVGKVALGWNITSE